MKVSGALVSRLIHGMNPVAVALIDENDGLLLGSIL